MEPSTNPNMDEAEIQQLLVGELGKPTTTRFQKKLLDRILENGRKKFGAISDSALQAESIRYFLARGVLNYEAANTDELKEGEERDIRRQGSRTRATRARSSP